MTQETKVNWLASNVKLAIAIISLTGMLAGGLITVVLYISTSNSTSAASVALLAKDIAFIKENHLVHIEKDINDIKIAQAVAVDSLKTAQATTNETLNKLAIQIATMAAKFDSYDIKITK